MSSHGRIQKVLIANRGEIAVRIARACRELGVTSVAVASDADRCAFHTRVADEVVEIGPAPANESYLRGDHVIEVAKARGCDAIHPGYGFLSQSAEFADAVAAAGLIFVGPSGDAMRLMGDKTAARATMEAAGVPVVPGFQGSGNETVEHLADEAAAVGFPLLVKAAAGGGGKGMRIVRTADDLEDALGSARREAESAFGDGRLFLERYVEDAHHVEFQVLADSHGTVMHLFERECSVQRRYQKIIEESPAPLLDDALRGEMARTAVAAATACGYENAGTIEFLVSAADRSFYFLEMNTRLQVEHPVTEWVTGVDLVVEQIRVAAGEPISFKQDELTQRGHAIECRIYAEDPEAGFAPSTGDLHLVHFPLGPGVRVDAGVETGDAVSVYYDPMIAKLIVHADDRDDALRKMRSVLAESAVLGVQHNLAFLQDVLNHPKFVAGEATTTFVDRELTGWKAPEPADKTDALIVAAIFDALDRAVAPSGAEAADTDQFSPWARRDGFRLGGS